MTTQQDIMALERRFWQAMMDQDIDTAVSLLDEHSTSVASRGIHRFTPAEYRAMAQAGGARITAFAFADEHVVFPTPGVAIASYQARQSFTLEGQEHTMTVFDTTTWVRKDGQWLAAAHTETPEHGASG